MLLNAGEQGSEMNAALETGPHPLTWHTNLHSAFLQDKLGVCAYLNRSAAVNQSCRLGAIWRGLRCCSFPPVDRLQQFWVPLLEALVRKLPAVRVYFPEALIGAK